MNIHLYVYRSICLSVCPSVRLSILPPRSTAAVSTSTGPRCQRSRYSTPPAVRMESLHTPYMGSSPYTIIYIHIYIYVYTLHVLNIHTHHALVFTRIGLGRTRWISRFLPRESGPVLPVGAAAAGLVAARLLAAERRVHRHGHL